MELNFNYIQNNSFEKRVADFSAVKRKYSNKIPLVIESKSFEMKKKKFLMEYDQTVTELLMALRKHQSLLPSEAVFLYAYDNTKPIILSGSDMIGVVYDKYKYNDGFLYIQIQKENTFGSKQVA